MTDKNETIARWMQEGHLYFCEECGERWGERPEVGKQPLMSGRELDIPKSHAKNGAVCQGPVLKEVPAYHESLDALVPVMESLKGDGYIDWCFACGADWISVAIWVNLKHYEGVGSTYAEALRNAIYAALVAMGEVTE